jgi:hypothetical protein
MSVTTDGAGHASFTASLSTGSPPVHVSATATSAAGSTSEFSHILVQTATHFSVSVPPSTTAGAAFDVTVTARDAFNNVVTGYGGTVQITSSDGDAILPPGAALTNGTGTFTVTLTTVGTGTQTVTASDGSITATSDPIAVAAAAASQFVLSVPGTTTAGTPISVGVTAKDPYGNVATAFGGLVQITSSDGNAALPPAAVLTDGAGTFSVTLKTVGTGTQTVTASSGSISQTSGPIVVSPAAAATLSASAGPATVTAGGSTTLTVTAKDPYGNTATGYSGTVHFTGGGAGATLPPDGALLGGTGSFSVTLITAGGQTVTATDTVNAGITGAAAVQVNPAAATHFTVTASPATITAGGSTTLTVTARDQYENTATGYAGTVHISGGGSGATLPADGALSAGVGSFTATLITAGSQPLMATDTADASITGGTAVQVNPAAASSFVVTATPTTVTAGGTTTLTVMAKDPYGNTATGYSGTVHVSGGGGGATLPPGGTLAAGVGSFSVTPVTAGSQTVTATDTANPAITGGTSVTVTPAAATHFVVTADPTTLTAGGATTLTVTAKDQYENTATGYSGAVHVSGGGAGATLPADGGLSAGVGAFSVTLITAGGQTLTATDTASAAIIGSAAVQVSPAAAASFVVTASPTSVTAGGSTTLTVTAKDAYGNTATGYAGTAHFTGGGAGATLPADGPLAAGVGTFAATLVTAGGQTVTATDTTNGSITGSAAVNVTPTAATQFVITGLPASVVAGGTVTATVTAKDQYGNTATGFAGTVTVTSSDAAATLPPPATLTAGVGTFTVTLKTAASQTLTATGGAISRTSGPIQVTPAAASQFVLTAPPTATAGLPVVVTITATDAYGNTAAGFAGPVTLTSSDPQAVLPSTTLANGAGSASVTFLTAGTQTVTAAAGPVVGTSAGVLVSAAAAGPVHRGQTATIGFWHNKNGQALIKSFNGGPTATALSGWLAAAFPKLYGAQAGANNLSGKTNAQVATYYLTLFGAKGQKLEAQVLATALAVYATTASLGGSAAAYGFEVTAGGLGASTFNVGSSGAAFGVANNSTRTVLQLLRAANDQAVGGVLYNGNSGLRSQANVVFTGINEVGDIG